MEGSKRKGSPPGSPLEAVQARRGPRVKVAGDSASDPVTQQPSKSFDSFVLRLSREPQPTSLQSVQNFFTSQNAYNRRIAEGAMTGQQSQSHVPHPLSLHPPSSSLATTSSFLPPSQQQHQKLSGVSFDDQQNNVPSPFVKLCIMHNGPVGLARYVQQLEKKNRELASAAVVSLSSRSGSRHNISGDNASGSDSESSGSSDSGSESDEHSSSFTGSTHSSDCTSGSTGMVASSGSLENNKEVACQPPTLSCHSSTRTLHLNSVSAPTAANAPTVVSPQAYLEQILRQRGYSTERVPAATSSYQGPCYGATTGEGAASGSDAFQVGGDAQPTPLSSYTAPFLEALKKKDFTFILAFLMEHNLSPNARNIYGETAVHAICRFGRVDVLRYLNDSGTVGGGSGTVSSPMQVLNLRVRDDYGRTPMHDACWCRVVSSSDSESKMNVHYFEVVKLLMSVDKNMIAIADVRGACPMEYVPRDGWNEWVDFIDSMKDVWWPIGGAENT